MKVIYLISRVFLACTFSNFLAHCEIYKYNIILGIDIKPNQASSNNKRKRDENASENFRNERFGKQMNNPTLQNRKKQNVNIQEGKKTGWPTTKNVTIIPIGGKRKPNTTSSTSAGVVDAKRAKFQDTLEQTKRKVGSTTKINKVVTLE